VARELASRFDTDLLFVHVKHNGAGVDSPDVDMPGVEAIVEHGHPADRLVAIAGERRASFLVVGSHGPRSSLLGSISADVARRAPCPVVAVPPTAVAGGSDPRYEPGVSVAGGVVRFDLAKA
jgi:nucleotide-binding universal stress UspA family protein